SASARVGTPTRRAAPCNPSRLPQQPSPARARNPRAARSRPAGGGDRPSRGRRWLGCAHAPHLGEFRVSLMLVVDEVIREERVEDELAREAEQIERARPILAQKRTHRAPVLADHELLFGLGTIRRVAVTPPELRDERLFARLAAEQPP